MANNDVEFNIKANISSAKKSLNEIVSTASKLANKIQDALNVSSVASATAEVKKLRKEMGATAEEIGTAKKAFYAFNLESGRAKSLKNQIRDVTNDPERKKLKRSLYSDRSRLKKLDPNSPDDADKVSKLNAKIAETEKALAPYEQKIESLKTKLDGVNERLAKMPEAARAFISEYSHAGEVADRILNSVNGVNASTEELAGKANKANSGFDGTKVAADGAAKAVEGLVEKENKANTPTNDRAEAIKQEDASLRGLLATLADYQTELEAARQSGKGLTDIEQRIAGVTDKINQKFQFSEAGDSISSLTRRLLELQSAKREIEQAGMPSSADAYYNKIYDAIQRTKGAINDYKRELNGVDESHEKASSSGKNFGKALKKASSIGRSALNALKAVINKIISGLKSAIRSVGKVINNIRSHFSGMAKDMNRNFKHLITNITKYVFGFRSLFFLVRRLRSQIKEGFQNLVQFNGGMNDVNYAISAILSSLLFLKNAWAAAFSPIVTFVQGWLTALIDKLAEVGNAIARFIGALTGQAIVFNAVKVDAGDYAKSLSDVGGSAGGAAKKTKQLTDRLAAFDDLNVLGKDKDPSGTGSGGGGGAGDASALDPNEMFKLVDVTQNFKDMLKDAWANADFTEIGSIIGDKLVGILNSINWGSIKQRAYNIGKSIITFINGALSDGALWATVGQTFAEGFNTLGEFASGILQNNTTDLGGGFATLINSFVTNFDWETFKSNFQTFFETLKDNINSFFSTLDLSTITVELSSLSESLTTSIVSLIEGINWEQIISSASAIGGAILDGIQQGLVSSDNPVLQSIGEFMGTARETIGKFISSLGAAFSSIGDVLATLEPVLGPLKEALSGMSDATRESFGKLLEQLPELMPSVSSIIEGIGSFYENLMTIIGGLIPVFVQLAGALTPFMSLMSDLITTILPVLLSLFDALSPILTAFSDSIVPVLSEGLELIKPVLEKISEFLSAIFSVAGDLIANFLELAGSIMEQLMPALEPFSDILSIIFDIFTDLFEPISALIEPLMEMLEVALEPLYILFDLLAASLKISVVPMLKLLSAFIKAVVVPWITILVNGIKGLIDIFYSLSTVIKFVRAVFNEGFNAIKNAVYTAVNAILGFMESLANGIVRGINKAIDGINSLNFTIPDWVPDVGGNSVGFHLTKLSTISIPRLAQGAVIPPNKEFMAILGDQTSGTNIEAPLDVIKQAVAEELSAQLEVLQDGFNSVVTAINNKNLNIGDKEIGKANARYLNQQRLIRGTSI